MEATADGVLAGVTAAAGDVIPVGKTIAWIVAPGEKPPLETATSAPAARTMSEQSKQAVASAACSCRGFGQTGERGRKGISEGPPDGAGARRRLEQSNGNRSWWNHQRRRRATRLGSAVPRQLRRTGWLLSSIARLMAERTTQSWTTAPHFFLVREIDASGLIAAREKYGKAITHTDLLVAIVARALVKHPKMNASWTGSTIQLNPAVNISIAIAVKDGVVGAVIPNADTAKLADISAKRQDLAERARAGRLHPPDVTGGTFTISNLGMFGVDAFSAIITPPQAAVLAVGRLSIAWCR